MSSAAVPLPPAPMSDADALARRLDFLRAMEALKLVERRTRVLDGSRRENSAEHSWHVALHALVLAPHAPAGADALRAMQMLLVHDVVEIRAGDTFAYDRAAAAGQAERERAAADELFGLLPDEQGAELRGLWEEFEADATPTARYANALDRLQPMLLNDAAGGGSWVEHAVVESAVRRRAEPVREALPAAWPVLDALIARNAAAGRIGAG